MATQQITAKQILSGTITTTQLAAAAGIADGQLANPYLYASGARSLAGVLNGGGFEAQNFAAPTAGGSLTTKSYVDGVAAGLSPKPSARAATVGTENYTVLAGTVTQITGTTVDGVAPAINDYILVKDAPAASGVGSVMSSQPGNGLYQVTSIVSNLAVSRATQMSGGNGPAGAYVFVEGGTVNAAAGYVVSVPSSNTGFTYGTNNIQWTQFSGAGEITVDATLVKTGNQLARAAIAGDVSIPAASNTATIANSAVGLAKMANLVANQIIGNATGGSAAPQSLNVGGGLEFTAGGIQRSALTGDVTAAAGSNAATIANSAVTLAKLANLAANSVIANITGSAAVPAAVAAVVTATANSVVVRDANANTKANAFISGTSSTVTAGATTTLTAASTAQQLFTGTAAQTCVLPDATTLVTGQPYIIGNRSTGNVTVNANGGALVTTVSGGSTATLTLTNTGSAAGSWDVATAGAGSGTVTSVSVVSANGFSGTVANASTAPAITMQTTINAILKGNGTALVAAVAGTDYMAPADFVTRETPSGTLNGSNTTFDGAVEDLRAADLRDRHRVHLLLVADPQNVGGHRRGQIRDGGTADGVIITRARVLQQTVEEHHLGARDRRVRQRDLTVEVTNKLPVANGGTGVATLTGLAKGNGVSAFTAATAGTDFVAPGGALGTPVSGTLTNCTGLPFQAITPTPGMLAPVQAHTDGSETYTIASGTVTQISGTTIQAGTYSPAVGDRILIACAPASTGTGSHLTNNPGNGIYVVTSNTTNLSVSRSADMSGSVNPIGLSVYSASSALRWAPNAVFMVISPGSGAFTYGVTSMTWGGAGGPNAFFAQNAFVDGNVTCSALAVANGANYVTLQGNSAATVAQTVTLPPQATDTLAGLKNIGTLAPVQAHTDGSETYTIASGTVTQIAGTQIQIDQATPYSPAVGDRILIHTAPAATGAGSFTNLTANPGNGIYIVTAVATNISLTRAPDMSGAVNPSGLTVYSENVNGWVAQSVWTVTTPHSASAFTYGTGNIQFASSSGVNMIPNNCYVVGLLTAGGATGNQFRWHNNPAGVYTYLNPNSAAVGASGDQTFTLPAQTTDTLVGRKDLVRNTTISGPGATPTVASDSYDVINYTALAAAITSMTTNLTGTPVLGQKLMLGFIDNGTARAITWGASFKSSGVATLLATTAASKQHWVGLMYDGTAWVCMAVDATGY